MKTTTFTNDTICAVSTPQGMGGIAVVRVSGPQAVEIVSKCWKGKDLSLIDSHTAHLGNVVESDGKMLDEVVLTLFRAPHSFTGEDVVEISCHGSRWIQQQLLHVLIDAGCRMAKAGEFTQRAFASGKMQLEQAEAVADLIASHSRASHRVAMNQMRGRFGQELRDLRQRLLHFVSLMELELDFSEEDVTFAQRSEVICLAQEIQSVITRLTTSFHDGNAIKNGMPVAIVGATNAGKSTLLNALLHDDRALVSDIHGTTRDVIEDTIVLGGTLFRFIDTAGIRDTSDTVEAMGISRSYSMMEKAQIVLWVIDATAPIDDVRLFAQNIISKCKGKQLIAIVNKTDIASGDSIKSDLNSILPAGSVVLTMSAFNEDDVERLQKAILQAATLPQVDEDTVIVTNARHYQALTLAGQALERATQGLREGLSADLVSQDIRDVLFHLGEITGEITTHEILGEIFSHFCIGK